MIESVAENNPSELLEIAELFVAEPSTTYLRYRVTEPWNASGFLYATDGHNAVRMRSDAPDTEEHKDRRPPVNDLAWPSETPDITFEPLPEIKVRFEEKDCEKCKGSGNDWKICPTCDGKGYKPCVTCGEPNDCDNDDCKHGKVPDPETACGACKSGKVKIAGPVQVGEATIPGDVYQMLRRLEGCRFYAPSFRQAVKIKFNQGQALVMPMPRNAML